MRAYLAILKDSFREAKASRVLWVAIFGIIAFLLALAPFGLQTNRITQLRRSDLVDVDRFLFDLSTEKEDEASIAAYVWSLLDDKQVTQLERHVNPPKEEEDAQQPGRPRGGFNQKQREVVNILNNLIEESDFIESSVWQTLDLDEETQELVDAGDVSDDDRQRRNLLLLEEAFYRSIRVSGTESVGVTYAGSEILGAFQLSPDDVEDFLDTTVFQIVAFFLGFFGVFASLLVTSGMIPRTFEPGEISLLLSKPVNRGLLFTTKFLGGCAFTLICAVLLVGGFWSIMGLRLGFWKHELLLSIPIYIFLFAIYYSISAFVGAIWRNSVISIVSVILFWLCITLLGSVKEGINQFAIEPERFMEITVAGNELVAVNSGRDLFVWNEDGAEWLPIMQETNNQQIPAFARRMMFSGTRFKPVYDQTKDRLLALQPSPGRMPGMGGSKVISGAAADAWEREAEADAPGTVNDLFVTSDGHVLLTDRAAIYEFMGRTDQEKKTENYMGSFLGNLLGAGSSSAFQEVQPEEMPSMAVEFSASVDVSTGTVVYYSEGHVHRFDRVTDESGSEEDETSQSSRYSLTTSRQLEISDSALLAISGNCITIATSEGQVFVLDAKDLSTITEDNLPDGQLPRVVEAAPDGSSHVVMTHSGSIWLVNAENGQPIDWRPYQNGDSKAVTFDSKGNLLISDGRRSIYRYDIGKESLLASYEHEPNWYVKAYDYVVVPFHTILPKPAELDNLAMYTMTGETSVNLGEGQPQGMGRRELLEERVEFDVWKPLLSNIGFVVFMLALGSLYVARKDY